MSLRLKLSALAVTSLLSACATAEGNPKDPFESLNRATFTFNTTLDDVAIKPAAETYRAVLPSFVQTGIGNFFGNIGDIWSSVNLLLQGKVEKGSQSILRVAFNTTFGVAGLFDFAGETGLYRQNADFGQTLGTWGVKSGPYVMLPVFGPSTLRDTAAFSVDLAGDVWLTTTPVVTRNSGSVVRIVDKRSNLLSASQLLSDAALDPYAFMRDAYLQRRESQIHPDD